MQPSEATAICPHPGPAGVKYNSLSLFFSFLILIYRRPFSTKAAVGQIAWALSFFLCFLPLFSTLYFFPLPPLPPPLSTLFILPFSPSSPRFNFVATLQFLPPLPPHQETNKGLVGSVQRQLAILLLTSGKRFLQMYRADSIAAQGTIAFSGVVYTRIWTH